MESQRKSNEAIDSFMQLSANLRWIVDRQDNLIYVNQSFLQYFNKALDILNHNISQVLPKNLADLFSRTHRLTRSQEKPQHTNMSSRLENGENVSLLVTSFAIDEQLVAGEAVNLKGETPSPGSGREQQARIDYLKNSHKEAVWEWDIVTGAVYRNKQLLDLIGYDKTSSNELIWWFERIHEGDRERVQNSVASAIENKQCSWEEEYQFQCGDGSFKLLLDRGVVIYEKDLAVKIVGSVQDLSELKQLRARLIEERLTHQKELAESIIDAQERERVRLGNELHDNVNQILTTARLYLDMMNPKDEHDIEVRTKTREFILMAYEEIRKLSKDLVSPQIKAESLTVGLQDLINDLTAASDFNIEFNYDPAIWVTKSMKITLYRIAQEQLKNVMQYSEATNIKVELRSRPEGIILRIEDDGKGFDPKKAKQGIGLSNIYERARLFGGLVDLETAPGKGCRITLMLPV